jgi:ATP-binding cassette subfamily B protein
MSGIKEIHDTKKPLGPFLKRLFRYCFKYPKWMISFAFFVLMVAAIEAIFPLVWMGLLDNVIMPFAEHYKNYYVTGIKPEADINGLLKYGLLFAGLGLGVAFSVFMFINFAGKIQENVMYDIRQEMFIKLQELSFSFYDRSQAGWLISRISSDASKVTELISWGLLEAFWGIGMMVFCVAAMFIYNWKLAIIVTSSVPVLFFVSFKIRMLILKYSREARRYNSDITAEFNENLNGIEVNKSLVQEARVSDEFMMLSEKMRHSSYRSAYYSAMFMPMIVFIGSIAAAIVVYYGGNLAAMLPPEITVGTLAAFFGYATLIFEPVYDISRFYTQAQGSLSAGERIFSLIDTKPLIYNSEKAGEFEDIKGEIEFCNVSFHYETGKPVLENFSLKINAGESVALVGETGSGKSTIINLVCRFYEPSSGVIKIDGHNYKTKTIESLTSRLGVVLQTPHLFSGTVRDNIKYANENADDKAVIDALLMVGANEFTDKLNEDVGEGGENLSLGQKQLISFARAILADPAIFIMDEATSSVDTLTEAKIQKGITKLMEGRTSIIIAHRLSTIRHCDRILVIDKGRIIEQGSHSELIKRKGHYYGLYTRQLREQREMELLSA